jgi:hypothetical protein
MIRYILRAMLMYVQHGRTVGFVSAILNFGNRDLNLVSGILDSGPGESRLAFSNRVLTRIWLRQRLTTVFDQRRGFKLPPGADIFGYCLYDL